MDFQWTFLRCAATSIAVFPHLGTLAFRGARFGQGVGPIFLDQLACRGDEQHVLDCNSFLRVPLCDHTQDAGIRCIGIYLDYIRTKWLVEDKLQGKVFITVCLLKKLDEMLSLI